MARVMVKEVLESHQFEAYVYTGDDGYPASQVFSPLYVTLYDGREFYLPQGMHRQDEDGFTFYAYRYNDDDKERLMRKIRQHGVDLDKWVYVPPRPSLEESLQEAWEIEEQERRGYR